MTSRDAIDAMSEDQRARHRAAERDYLRAARAADERYAREAAAAKREYDKAMEVINARRRAAYELAQSAHDVTMHQLSREVGAVVL